MKKEISIKNVNRIRIENRMEFESSLFSEQYRSMDRIVCSILKRQRDLESQQDPADAFANENYVHNMIAIVGERGMGKSSVMLSYAYFLKECYRKQYADIPKELCDKEFCVLGKVDANMINGREYLVDIILAKMWDAFREEFMARTPRDQEGKDLEDSFAKVKKSYIDFKNVSNGRNEIKEYAPLQQLHDLSASMNLRVDFAKLIERYLNYMGKCDTKQRYLVVCIDDMDLITNCAYERLQEIHSFFTIPHVLVFLSLDIQRMHMDLCKMFAGRLLWDDGATSLRNKVSDYAEAYIAKILPRNARVYMPYFGADLNNLVINNVGSVLEDVLGIAKITSISVGAFIRMFFLYKMNIMFHDGVNILFSSKRSLRNIVNRIYELIDLLQQEDDEETIRLWIKKELSVSAEQLQDDESRIRVYKIMEIDDEDYNYYFANLSGKEYVAQKKASYQRVIVALDEEKENSHVEQDYFRLLVLQYSVVLTVHMQDPFAVFKENFIKNDMLNGMLPEKNRRGWGNEKKFLTNFKIKREGNLKESLLKNAKQVVGVFHGLLILDIDVLKITVEEKDVGGQVDLAGGEEIIGQLEKPEKKMNETEFQFNVSGKKISISIDNYFYNVFEYENKWRIFIAKLCETDELSKEEIIEVADSVALHGGLQLEKFLNWRKTYQVNTFCDLIPLQNIDIMMALSEHLKTAELESITEQSLRYPILVKQIIDCIVETFSAEEMKQCPDDVQCEQYLGKKYLYSEKIREVYQIAPYTGEEIQAFSMLDSGPNTTDL